jgi:hypothetical protein
VTDRGCHANGSVTARLDHLLIALLASIGALSVGGCGDDDPSGAIGEDGSRSSGFCVGLREVYEDLGGGVDTDLTEEQARDAVDELGALDPPAELADDYATFLGALELILDPPDDDLGSPDDELVAEWRGAIGHLNAYAEDTCGIVVPDAGA